MSFQHNCKAVSSLIVNCLRVTHCRHNNFVLVSRLVVQNPLVNSGLLANVSEANAKNLETIASLLSDLLLCLSTPEDTRLLYSHAVCSVLLCVMWFPFDTL